MKNKPKLIFWQNIISLHQAYFFNQISSKFEVILIVENFISTERKLQGWNIPEIDNIEIIKITDKEHLDLLIHQFKNEKNIFSGLMGMGHPNLKKASIEISKYRKIIIISESPIQQGIKTYGRKFLYKLYYLKYRNKISHIFAMGNIGVDWFKNSGFSDKKITPFFYFIKPEDEVMSQNFHQDKKQYLFIGQLIRRKGIDHFIEALSELDRNKWNLKIIGKGPEESSIHALIKKYNLKENIEFCGTVQNENVLEYIKKSDYLVLPSRFDGWGAVISEALSVGIKVICNDRCGASVLVSQEMGYVYKQGNKSSLVNALNKSVVEKPYDEKKVIVNYTQAIDDKIKEFIDKIESL
jgi:glycosyltransferase involved in cell wall biosynthesis